MLGGRRQRIRRRRCLLLLRRQWARDGTLGIRERIDLGEGWRRIREDVWRECLSRCVADLVHLIVRLLQVECALLLPALTLLSLLPVLLLRGECLAADRDEAIA